MTEADWPAVQGELSAGAATHRLQAAEHTLVIDYWTNEMPGEWTPDSSPIILLSARIDGSETAQAVRLTRFSARVDELGVQLVDDTGSFPVDPPYAYSSGFSVPANPTATSTKIIVTIDLLTETAPGSGDFTRQTVIDALTIGYPKPGSVVRDAATE